MRTCKAMLSGFAAAAMLAGLAGAADAARYRVEDLGVLPNSYPSSIATGINARGDVVGWSGSGPVRAFRYTQGGGMVALRGSSAYPGGCHAYEINDAGIVAGACGTSPVRAFRWSPNGTPTDLGDLGGGISTAYSVGNSNIVVGDAGASGNWLPQAFRYTAAVGMGDITPGSGLSLAHDVNNLRNPHITGWENSVAFRWRGGVLTSLRAPQGYAYSFGYGVNDAGTVVGSVKKLQSSLTYFARHTPGKGWQVLTGSIAIGGLRAINNHGVSVGSGRAAGGGEVGVVHDDATGVRELNTLVDAPRNWSIVGAYDINDTGQIAAQGFLIATGEFHAVRLTPIAD